MLEGFVPFPAEFAARYRERGYWRDQSLAQEFSVVFERFATRVALTDGERVYRYADIDRLSDNLALNLLELGLKPLDRVVPTLPNVAEFVILYFALQKIGCIPIAALATHRYLEISQFVQLSQARACIYPQAQGDFQFAPVMTRVQAENPSLQWRIVLGEAGPGEHSLVDLIERPARGDRQALRDIVIDPCDPCIFQLSGGTTGIPKLIPRTGNDYAYNSKTAAEVTRVDADSVLLLVLPIAHNLPLACPGIQGFMFAGAKVVLHGNTRPAEMFALIEKHGVTHLKVVPALLIRMINDPSIGRFNLTSLRLIQSGGQRMQPEVRLRTQQLIPSAMVQENFGMSEGLLMFVRHGDPDEVMLETCGRPVSPDDEVRLIDDDGQEV
ncbi:MAG: (2,3-dihydroxybenzoyl)adenylate synthase, partial [Rhizobacter sp.]|nr:(2,3-dihydroxybenzoyl)adenylate synthase [Rhizobacter sp.]